MSTTTEPNLGLKIEWDEVALRWVASGTVAHGPCGASIVTEAQTIPELLRKVADRAEAMLRQPTEAEKIHERRADLIDTLLADPNASAGKIASRIRASDEAAGYVLVPTSGEGFERMVRAMRAVDDGISTGYADWLRAALEVAKGGAR